MWRVFIVQMTLKIYDYRKLARAQKERIRAVYHYEYTIFELLKCLQMKREAFFRSSVEGESFWDPSC